MRERVLFSLLFEDLRQVLVNVLLSIFTLLSELLKFFGIFEVFEVVKSVSSLATGGRRFFHHLLAVNFVQVTDLLKIWRGGF